MNQRPNLILITIDALRADHLGFMGYEKDTSPNIDSLAKESIVFKNAFAVGPTTPYSFPSILTSTYPLDYQGPREIKKPRVIAVRQNVPIIILERIVANTKLPKTPKNTTSGLIGRVFFRTV